MDDVRAEAARTATPPLLRRLGLAGPVLIGLGAMLGAGVLTAGLTGRAVRLWAVRGQ